MQNDHDSEDDDDAKTDRIIEVFQTHMSETPLGRRPLGHLDDEQRQFREMEKAFSAMAYQGKIWKFHLDRLFSRAASKLRQPITSYNDQSHLDSNHIYECYEDVFDDLGLTEFRAGFMPNETFYYPEQAAEGQRADLFPQWAVLADPIGESLGVKMQNREIRFEIGGLYYMAAFKFEPVTKEDGSENDYKMALSQCQLYNGSDIVSIETDTYAPDYDRGVIDKMLAISRDITDDINAGRDAADQFKRYAPIWRHLWDRAALCEAVDYDEDLTPPYKPFQP